jgi:HTH-type transcriptional regulator/antitoxin HigA
MRTELVVIETEADYQEALALVDGLLGSEDKADAARLRAQARLIEDYERTRWPRERATLPELLTYLLDQHDLSRDDLVPLIGSARQVEDVLSGRMTLTAEMVQRLRDRFGVPADLLIPPATPAAA